MFLLLNMAPYTGLFTGTDVKPSGMGQCVCRFQTIVLPSAQRSRFPKQATGVSDPSIWRHPDPSKRRKTIHPMIVSHYRRTAVLNPNFAAYNSYIVRNTLPKGNKKCIMNLYKPVNAEWPGGVLWLLLPFDRRCPRPPLILAGSRVADEIGS
jgi:hypothetical protein